MRFPALSVLLVLSSTASVSAFGVPRHQVSFSRGAALNADPYDFSTGVDTPKPEKKSKKKAPAPKPEPEPEPVPEPVPEPTPAPVAEKPKRGRKSKKVEEPVVEAPKVEPKVEEPKVEEPKSKRKGKKAKVVEEPVVEAPKLEEKILKEEPKPAPKTKAPKKAKVEEPKAVASSSKDASTVPKGIALGAAPLAIAPIVALGAVRSTLTKTKDRREEIAKEIAEFEAAEAAKKAKKDSEVDGATLAKAVVSSDILTRKKCFNLHVPYHLEELFLIIILMHHCLFVIFFSGYSWSWSWSTRSHYHRTICRH